MNKTDIDMKKILISYSIEIDKLHLITLFIEHLRKNSFSVSVSTHWVNPYLKKYNSDLFIGIISNLGDSTDYVLRDFNEAKKSIPSILVYEEGIDFTVKSTQSIEFSRCNKQIAISDLLSQRQKKKIKQYMLPWQL